MSREKELVLLTISRDAAAAISTRYLACVIDSNDKIAVASAGGEMHGVNRNTVTATTDAVAMETGEYLLATAGTGGWTRGDKLKVESGGKLIATTTAGDLVVAEALVTISANDTGLIRRLPKASYGYVGSALTDNSTGSAGTTIAAGVGIYNLTFQFDLADIADGDLVSDLLLNHKFKIIESYFVATEPVTTGSKATTISLAISDVNVTNSEIALTSANCTPAGAKVQNAGALAANTGAANATLTVKAASTTAFLEGKGVLVIAIQNMDSADAIASLAARVNQARND